MGVNRTRPVIVMSREEHYTKSLRERFSTDHADFGLEHGLGWLGIIHTLHYRLMHFDPEYVVYQIKEKFASLRFYARVDTTEMSDEDADKVANIIRDAEHATNTTCEICGAPGTATEKSGWWRTRCGECRQKEKEADEAASSDTA